VPADVLDVQILRLPARLEGHVTQVLDRHVVFEVPGQGGELQAPLVVPPQGAEDLQQPFVDAVELVAVAVVAVLQPVPLDDGGLQKGRGGVGVVLQQLRPAGAVVAQVEAPINGVLVPPRMEPIMMAAALFSFSTSSRVKWLPGVSLSKTQ
jgi:hypothetical protein